MTERSHWNNPENKPIRNLKELRAARARLRVVIREQELELREQVKSLPAETFKAGVSRLFSGKTGAGLGGPVAGVVLSAVTAFLGTYVTKKAAAAVTGKAGFNLVKSGLLALAPLLLKRFMKKTSDTK